MQNKASNQYEESQLVVRRKYFMCPECYHEIPESVAQLLSAEKEDQVKCQEKTMKEEVKGFRKLTFEDIAIFNTNTKQAELAQQEEIQTFPGCECFQKKNKKIQNPEEVPLKVDSDLVRAKVPNGSVEIQVYIHIPPKF